MTYLHIYGKASCWNVSLLIQLWHYVMTERDQGRVLDESVIRSDSSDNESSEEDSVSAQVASVMNNLIFLNNIAFYFFYVIATWCTIGSVQIGKSEFLCL